MMESEINSQSEVLGNLVEKHIVNYCVLADIPVNISRIVIVGSGSSYNAGLLAKNFFQNIADIETSVEYASEIANSDFDNFRPDTTYIFVSQSGKSEDVISAFNKVKRMNAKTVAITNNIESYLYEKADYKFNINAQREYAIAATKTFSATVLILWIIALKAAQNKHLAITNEIKGIYTIKNHLIELFKNIENLNGAAKFLAKQKGFSIVGLGQNFAIAKEASLKIKETCYINTNAYPMGEFLHGHFALLNENKVLLAFLTSYATENEISIYKKIISTYKTKSIIISDEFNDFKSKYLIKFNKSESKIINTLCMIIIIQLLAFKMARRLHHNVDKPTGLNKVVS